MACFEIETNAVRHVILVAPKVQNFRVMPFGHVTAMHRFHTVVASLTGLSITTCHPPATNISSLRDFQPCCNETAFKRVANAVRHAI